MKPRTKQQLEVASLSRYIKPIYSQELNWAYKNCLDHVAYQNKTQTSCMDCGHQWKEKPSRKKTCICPNCNTKLIIIKTQKRVYKQETYFAILDVCSGYQVVRYFDLHSYHKTKQEADYTAEEVLQQWIKPNGKYELFGYRHRVSYYYDCWLGQFEIREKNPSRYQYWKKDLYNLNPQAIYPDAEILPELKRNGFKGCCHGIAPLDLLLSILSDNRAESLLKMKQFELLKFYITKERYKIDRYWDSIKICQRNKYVVKDATMWFDYLYLLDALHKDLRSPKYICPKNLKAEHDKYVKKKDRKDLQDKLKRMKAHIEKAEKQYAIDKQRFLDLHFTDGEITVRPLKNVKEFLEEGTMLHHCVYTNEYYKEKDSLILTARIDNIPIETIEVSLDRLEVNQCQGKLNENSPYHDKILKLVRKNMRKIHKADISSDKKKEQEMVAV